MCLLLTTNIKYKHVIQQSDIGIPTIFHLDSELIECIDFTMILQFFFCLCRP